MTAKEGPAAIVTLSCYECRFVCNDSYTIQSEYGFKVYCTKTGTKRYIGDTIWTTPEWCPFLKLKFNE